jgi:hypothetical protein
LKYNCTSSSSVHTRRREERREGQDRAALHCTALHSSGGQGRVEEDKAESSTGEESRAEILSEDFVKTV